MIHDGHAIAQLVGLFHVMRGDQDRLALTMELAQYLPERQPALRVEAGGGFVEEQHLWPMHDGARDHQPLRHTARQRHDGSRRAVRQTHPLEKLLRFAPGVVLGHPEIATVELEVLEDRHRAIEGVGLRDDTDDLLGDGRAGDHVDAPDCGATAGRRHACREHPDRRRLSRAVRSEQSEDLAGVYAEVEPVDGGDVRWILLGQCFGDDDVGHRENPRARAAPGGAGARARAAPGGAGSYDRQSHHVVPGGEALCRIVPRDR